MDRVLHLRCASSAVRGIDPVVSSDPDFVFILISGVSAMLLGAIAGAYLLLGYLVRWATRG